MMLLLMGGLSLPFIAFLFVSTFSFPFSHAFLNFLIIFLFSLVLLTISSHRPVVQHSHPFPGGVRWLFASSAGLLMAFP